MFNSVLAHLGSLFVGKIVEWAVWLTFGIINLGFAFILNVALTPLLFRCGMTVDAVSRLNQKNTAGFFYLTGVVEGFAAILCSLLVFRWLDREPGLIMLTLLIVLQLIPLPSFISSSAAQNMRTASRGAIAGLLIAYWLYYPPFSLTTSQIQLTPELLGGLAVFFFFLGLRGLGEWQGASRPLFFGHLGRFGNFVHLSLQAVVLLGGLSLVIWAFINAAWWSVPVAIVVGWVCVQLTRVSIYIDAFVTSVFGSVLSSIAIIVLHFFTWFPLFWPMS